jgi:hypothetical protein
MKILIAYDGSEFADTAIDGLQRAGLPKENVEAFMLKSLAPNASSLGQPASVVDSNE